MNDSRFQQLKQLCFDEPSDPFNHYALALEYISLENQHEAINCLQKVLLIDRDYLPAYYQLALLLMIKDPQKAKELCEQGAKLALQKNNKKTYNELNSLYQEISFNES
jgi:tetratricopeptide (TPR) repeat protein